MRMCVLEYTTRSVLLCGVIRDLMRKVKMASAHEGKSVKDFLIELAEAMIHEFERKGILPRGK